MKLLGPRWKYIVTDVTEGPGGNGERIAYVFDSRKVRFESVAGEIVLPRSQLIDGERQFARTPFLGAFQSHWLKFNLCSVHMYYGSASGAGLERRIKEIGRIGKFLRKRYERYDENFVLLGDMNIVDPDDRTMKALQKSKFSIPEHGPTNMAGTKHYDQIAFLKRSGELELGPSKKNGKPNNCGVLKIYKSVFRTRDLDIYYPLGKKNGKWPRGEAARKKYFGTWRTFQISDHLPLWVELKIDFTEKYLKRIRNPS